MSVPAVGIRIEGAGQALKALRVMEPETAKQVGREMSDIGRTIGMLAAAKAPKGPPVSGWKQTSGARGSRGGAGWPAWGPISTKSSRRGMSVRVAIMSAEPAIASFAESLGRGEKWRTTQGLNLVTHARLRWSPLVQSGKKEGRVARAAISEAYPEVIAALRKAVDRAVDEVNRRMP